MNNSLTVLILASTSFCFLMALAFTLFLGKRRVKKSLDTTREEIRRLRETAENYQLLAENINEVIFILDVATLRYRYVSPSILRTHGWTPEEAVKLTFDKHITPASLELVFKTITTALELDERPGDGLNRDLILETEQYRKDGSTIWMETIAKPLRDEAGRIATVIGAARDITDRKEAETRLKESEKLHRMLAENIHDVIYMVDIATLRYTYVSPSVIHTHGFTPEEMVSLSIEEIQTPRSLEMALKVLADELEQDKLPGVDPNRYLTLEMEQYRKDGSIILIETTVKFLRNDSGHPVSIVGVARDIGKRKKAETDLKKSEERYRLLAENINEVIYIINLKTMRYEYATPSVKRVHGYTPEEFIQLGLDKVLTPASLDMAMEAIQTELENDGKPGVDPDRFVTVELECYRRDGSTLFVENSARFLRDEAGKAVSILGLARDISDRKQTENDLRESEERYRMLTENISEVIYLINPRTLRHVFITPSVFQMLGYTPEELLELPFNKILTPQSFAEAITAVRANLAKSKPLNEAPPEYVTLELEVFRKDGSTVWVETTGRIFFDENQDPLYLLGVSRDITQRKAAAEELKRAKETAEAASQAKSEFLANMSHEIRTPMNGVIGMTELLLDTALSAEQFEYAESLKSSAEALLVIINDVLDFSKIEAGMINLEIIAFDLNKLCKEVHDTISLKAKRKHIAYNTVIMDDVPVQLKGDPVRLRQVLINLCENAVKFTESGSVTITVSLAEKTETAVRLQFEVADTGIGIPLKHHQKIFDSFSQVDASTTRRFGGTGLGLTISKKLITLLGGEISVTSQPGSGTTFRFLVPFEEQDRQMASTLPPVKPTGKAGPLKILLAEDNPTSRKVIKEMLANLGHFVTVALNGAEAVETFDSQSFDLVLMDIQMPVMDGITATNQIHALQQGKSRKAPVIALTANAMAGDRERFLDQGLDDYVAKPVTLEKLKSVIRRNTFRIKTA